MSAPRPASRHPRGERWRSKTSFSTCRKAGEPQAQGPLGQSFFDFLIYLNQEAVREWHIMCATTAFFYALFAARDRAQPLRPRGVLNLHLRELTLRKLRLRPSSYLTGDWEECPRHQKPRKGAARSFQRPLPSSSG